MKDVLNEIACGWRGVQPVDMRCTYDVNEWSTFTVAVEPRKLAALLKAYKVEVDPRFKVTLFEAVEPRPRVHVAFKHARDDLYAGFDAFYEWLNMMLI